MEMYKQSIFKFALAWTQNTYTWNYNKLDHLSLMQGVGLQQQMPKTNKQTYPKHIFEQYPNTNH